MNIKNLPNWLTTNTVTGEKYHTLLHCAENDYYTTYTLVFLCVFIVIQYLTVAYTAYKKSKDHNNSIESKSIRSLMYVFAFCSVAGYLFRVMQLYFPAYKFLVFMLLVLNVVTFKLLHHLNKTKFFDKLFPLLNESKKLEEEVLKLKSEKIKAQLKIEALEAKYRR